MVSFDNSDEDLAGELIESFVNSKGFGDVIALTSPDEDATDVPAGDDGILGAVRLVSFDNSDEDLAGKFERFSNGKRFGVATALTPMIQQLEMAQ